jgi:hypothetical protein
MIRRDITALTAACACGAVKLATNGDPIVTLSCYCGDCQEGGRRMEALPGAAPIRDRDGGTAYVIFRKDRMRCIAGAECLEARKIRERSPTNRVVATCCNSAMYLNFDDGKHWVDIYRPRIEGGLPPIQMRVCTKFIAEGVPLSSDVPNCSGYPVTFLMKLVSAKVGMMLGL